jgi:hypothetical protein
MVQLVAKELILVISVVPRLREQRGATLGFSKEKSSSSASAGKDKTTSSSSSHSRGKNSPAKVLASGSSTPSSRSVGKSTPQTISTPSSTNSLPSFFEVKKKPIHACFSTLILVEQLFLIMGYCFSKITMTFTHNLKLRKILMSTCSSHNCITIFQTSTSLVFKNFHKNFFQ